MLKRTLPFFIIVVVLLAFLSCSKNQESIDELEMKSTPKKSEFGFVYSDFNVVHDTIKSGDTFGSIIQKQNIGEKEVYDIIEKVKDTFDVRTIRFNKPYVCYFDPNIKKTNYKFLFTNQTR